MAGRDSRRVSGERTTSEPLNPEPLNLEPMNGYESEYRSLILYLLDYPLFIEYIDFFRKEDLVVYNL